MTTTLPENDTPAVEQVAAGNARWLAERLAAGDVEALRFLRYRPSRELADVQTAARRVGASDAAARPAMTEVASVLDDALQLARGHTGGPSTCPLGYVPLEYPVTDEEKARLLQQAADATRILRLPGAERGWTWNHAVDVDVDEMTVTIRLQARHP